jgi:hypothetical protein
MAAVPARAATGGEIVWRWMDCAQSQLQLFDWMECRVSAEEMVEKNLEGTARNYATMGGTANAASGMILSMPAPGGQYGPYPKAESEQAIRSAIAAMGRQVEQWGPYQGFDRTGYMAFTSDEMNCVGFDHGGNYVKAGGRAPGYAYLVRGYFCERGPLPDPKRRLVQYLEATRIGPRNLARSAMDGRLRPLDGAAWYSAARLTDPFAMAAPRTMTFLPAIATSTAAMPADAMLPSPVPQAISTAPPAPAPAISAASFAIPARVSWGGEISQGDAQVTPHINGHDASFAFGIEGGARRCNGTLVSNAGTIGPGVPSDGTWSTTCSDGQSAVGSLRDEGGRSVAIGNDTMGRSVSITFGQ